MAAPSDIENGVRCERVLTWAALAVAGAIFAAWLPNYLRWPLFVDADYFAQIAREWDSGIAPPYRDTLCYNTPGQIYLFWIAGKLFGWGRTAAVQLVDAALLVAFLGGLVAWSRRRFESALPGALAALGVMAFYAGCGYYVAGQRTWQAGLLGAGSILAAQALGGRRGPILSGALLGAAVLFRPEAAPWGLGALAAVIVGALERDRNALRTAMLWGLGAAGATVLGMLPLLASGVLGDFLAALRAGVSGRYYDPATCVSRPFWTIVGEFPLYEFLSPYPVRFILVGLPALWLIALVRGNARARADLAVWVVSGVWVGLAAFRAPFFIGYLVLPIALAALLTVAPALAALRDDLLKTPALAAVVVLGLGLVLVPGVPAYCTPRLSWRTCRAVARGKPVAEPPLYVKPDASDADRRRVWEDYRACVAYLRNDLPKGRTVWNAVDPFGERGGLGLTFAAERRTGGYSTMLLWPSVPNAWFERALAAAADDPRSALIIDARKLNAEAPAGAPPMKAQLGRWNSELTGVLKSRFEPTARFGPLEVWVRKPETPQLDIATRPTNPPR
jgi:hypothetical protein